MEKEVLGWYSQQSVNEGNGTNIWRTSSGEEVEITGTGTVDDFKWPDRELRGVVVAWVRVGIPATNHAHMHRR